MQTNLGSAPRPPAPRKGLYERLGGIEYFEALIDRFYTAVATDEVLRPLYPEDLEGPRRRLCLFLAQFWGGPRLYEKERGDPRLGARHLQFKIGPAERDRWLELMTAAVDASGAGPLERAQILNSFCSMANHLVNTDAPATGG
ncbi:MAG: globin [Acidimicrobiales bacterium]